LKQPTLPPLLNITRSDYWKSTELTPTAHVFGYWRLSDSDFGLPEQIWGVYAALVL
jgi:hypothetical protein